MSIDNSSKVLLQFGLHRKGMKNTKTKLKDRRQMLYEDIIEEWEKATNKKRSDVLNFIETLSVAKSPDKFLKNSLAKEEEEC